MNNVSERFWSKVSQTGNVCECWFWNALKNENGYGYVSVAGKMRRAHRVAYEMVHGFSPPEIDHLCSNRDCVNPWHLESVSHKTNMNRSDAFKAWKKIQSALQRSKSACDKGHPYSEENTAIRKNGSRTCRECNRINCQRWRKQNGRT